ncbi:hypothetical protein I4F81_003083 [Pyropia yezoensis]|uniref:Uncharacterized protein n=1 Tax=Pyropia yezoensis TaxID=2788 RepID=A0ACC3BR77_PYRYE|nr:hypothetical protein I4F81_003083 [Neopyropia yezoensis]
MRRTCGGGWLLPPHAGPPWLPASPIHEGGSTTASARRPPARPSAWPFARPRPRVCPPRFPVGGRATATPRHMCRAEGVGGWRRVASTRGDDKKAGTSVAFIGELALHASLLPFTPRTM